MLDALSLHRCQATFAAPLIQLLKARPRLRELDASDTEMPLSALKELPHTLKLVNVSGCFMPPNEIRSQDGAHLHKYKLQEAVEALQRRDGGRRVRAHIDYSHKFAQDTSLQADLEENPYMSFYCTDWRAAQKVPGQRVCLECHFRAAAADDIFRKNGWGPYDKSG